ncbi:Hypothetical predicted protein [Olea europaea subsp. europaea]|uniref:Uncharacterized protein n=1 Tax=Olea europaea subsp. europaea TaxID=158383 RepID=A0A8S0PJD5_OLEEU|nr:Hypothetical predicted protein [Olea europaea subsp. europaea]
MDELARQSKLNPPPPPKKKREGKGKGKEKVEPSRDVSLKKSIEAEPISAEVQLATSLCYKYWMEKYFNCVETCDAMDMMEVGLAMHASSQGFFVNVQMDMRRLQKANREFERKTFEVVADAQKLKDEIAMAEEALEASKLTHAELESIVEQLT